MHKYPLETQNIAQSIVYRLKVQWQLFCDLSENSGQFFGQTVWSLSQQNSFSFSPYPLTLLFVISLPIIMCYSFDMRVLSINISHIFFSGFHRSSCRRTTAGRSHEALDTSQDAMARVLQGQRGAVRRQLRAAPVHVRKLINFSPSLLCVNIDFNQNKKLSTSFGQFLLL